VAARQDGAKGIGSLLRELAEGGTALVRKEAALARIELREVATALGRGTALTAIGAVLGLLGALSFLAGFIMLVGDQWLARDRYWLASLIVLLLSGAVAAWLAKRGMKLLSPRELMPVETVETLKEDKEWLKRQLTSGAT
jgi:drug/metabolite transporter (DMT)-like permease